LEIDQGELPRKILVEGTGEVCPIEGADVVISYKLTYLGKEIEKKENFKFMLSDGTVLEGINKIVEDMSKGEVLEAKIPSKFAFGSTGAPDLGVPANSKAPVDLWITLVDFEVMKFNYEMNNEEVFAFVLKQKNRGNDFVKEKKYKLALIQYERAVAYIRNDSKFGDEEKRKRQILERDCYLNIALCNLQLKDVKAAIKACDESLKREITVKGLFRKAQAISTTGEHEEAKNVLKEALALDSSNVDVIKAIEKADHEIHAQNERDRKKFANLFK
jgi:tetratricopeptide (TPR) repeat protein